MAHMMFFFGRESYSLVPLKYQEVLGWALGKRQLLSHACRVWSMASEKLGVPYCRSYTYNYRALGCRLGSPCLWKLPPERQVDW